MQEGEVYRTSVNTTAIKLLLAIKRKLNFKLAFFVYPFDYLESTFKNMGKKYPFLIYLPQNCSEIIAKLTINLTGLIANF